jgi:hypothetical protein
LVGFGGESHAELEDIRRAHANNGVETIGDVHLDKLDGTVGRVSTKDNIAKQARQGIAIAWHPGQQWGPCHHLGQRRYKNR